MISPFGRHVCIWCSSLLSHVYVVMLISFPTNTPSRKLCDPPSPSELANKTHQAESCFRGQLSEFPVSTVLTLRVCGLCAQRNLERPSTFRLEVFCTFWGNLYNSQTSWQRHLVHWGQVSKIRRVSDSGDHVQDHQNANFRHLLTASSFWACKCPWNSMEPGSWTKNVQLKGGDLFSLSLFFWNKKRVQRDKLRFSNFEQTLSDVAEIAPGKSNHCANSLQRGQGLSFPQRTWIVGRKSFCMVVNRATVQ